MLSFYLGNIRFLSTLLMLSTGVAAATTGCRQGAQHVSATEADEQLAPQAAAPGAVPAYDLSDAFALQGILLESKTRLELTQAEFIDFKAMLPDSLTALAEGLIPPEKIAKVFVKDGDDLLRFVLTEEALIVPGTIVPQMTLMLANTVSIQRIVEPDATHAYYRVTVKGVTLGTKRVEALYLLTTGDVQLVLEDGGEATLSIPALKTLFSSGDLISGFPVPTAATMAKALFAATEAIRVSPAANVMHIKSKKLDAQGQPAKDAQGRAIPDLENRFRKLLREQMAAANLDANLLALADRITDIYVDNTGIQVWLSEPVTLSFSDGTASLAAYVKLQANGPTSIVPVQGVSAVAYEADGAYIQQFRFVDTGNGAGRLDVDVYGYKQTLLGQFGQSRTVSFDF